MSSKRQSPLHHQIIWSIFLFGQGTGVLLGLYHLSCIDKKFNIAGLFGKVAGPAYI